MYILEWAMSPSHPQFDTSDPEWYDYTTFNTLSEATAYRHKLIAEGIWDVSSLPQD